MATWASVRFWRRTKQAVIVLDILLLGLLLMRMKGEAAYSASTSTTRGTIATASGVRLRESPSLTAASVSAVANGAEVEVLDTLGPAETINGRTEHWMKLKYRSHEGWAWGGYVSRERP